MGEMRDSGPGTGDDTTDQSGLIERFGAGPIAAAVVVVVGALVAVFAFTSSEDPSPPTTSTASAAPTSTTEAEGPQVAPIDTCTLLPERLVDEALGLVDADGRFRSSGAVMFEIGETCRWEADIDDTGETVILELGPGDQADFAAETRIEDVAGTEQSDVGDLAVWYGGDTGGVMSAATDTDNGVLFVRLSIERPEIDDATRRTYAAELVTTAIERIRFGPPAPVEVDLCEMISDEDAEAVLAPHREGRPGARSEVFGGGSPQNVDLAEPGDADCQKLILTEIYVTAAMGAESDFEPGAEIDGVRGRPIVGIGDEAAWFEAVPGGGAFASPHDTDIIAVRSGRAMFRIVTALPDFDRTEQIDATTHLALEALNRLPGADSSVVDETIETFDSAQIGFVDNVLARADAGEWTIEEGLIATLSLFAGETASDDVLDDVELIDGSGTEVLRMARTYVAAGPDAGARGELERLIGLLTVPILDTAGEADPDVSGATPLLSRSRSPLASALTRTAFNLASQTGDEDEPDEPPPSEPENDRGYAPPPDFPDDNPDLQLEDTPVVPCDFAGVDGWTAEPAYDSRDGDPLKAQVLFPESGFPPGWNELHLEYIRNAVQETLDLFSPASSPCLGVVMATHGGSSSWVLDTIAPNLCAIFLNTPMQSWEEARFKQAVARDIAHCMVFAKWPDQFGIATYTDRHWWNGALAEFFGNAVYPAAQCQAGRCDLEWRLTATMRAQERSVPMMHRQDANWMFFQHLWWLGGLEGVVDLVGRLPANGDPVAHEVAMAEVAGMNEVFQRFTEKLTDGGVEDSGGGVIVYDPPAEQISVSGPRTIQRNLDVFGVKRLHLSVDTGKTACLEAETADVVLAAYRPGPPGAVGAGADWEALPTETTQLAGEFVVVATSTDPDGSFSIEITDVVDDGDECEEEDEASTPAPVDVPDMPCMEICGPSDFYRFHEQLLEWFLEAIGA